MIYSSLMCFQCGISNLIVSVQHGFLLLLLLSGVNEWQRGPTLFSPLSRQYLERCAGSLKEIESTDQRQVQYCRTAASTFRRQTSGFMALN